MNPAPPEALEALERLVFRHKVISEEQGRAAGRLITGDATWAFAPPPSAAAEPSPPSTESL